MVGEPEHGLPVALHGKGVASDQQWAEMVVHRSLHHGGGVPGLAQPHDALIGVYVNPDDLGPLLDSNGLDLRDFQPGIFLSISGRSCGCPKAP